MLIAVTLLTNSAFLVMADMPYTSVDHERLAPSGKLYEQVQVTEHAFLMHLGDMKAGREACTDERLMQNKALLHSITKKPFIYTPGDNDWTDCDRKNLTPNFDELARLDYLKALMYDMAYFQQAAKLNSFKAQQSMQENARWQHAGIQFMTLHIAGTHNGRRFILKSDKTEAYRRATQRDKLNLQWLGQANPNAKAYVIGFQADIYSNNTSEPACSETRTTQCDGFKVYREALASFADKVSKPVLVMHGDTGAYCIEKLTDNLTRFNGPGDYLASDITQVEFIMNPKPDTLNWQFTRLGKGQPLTRWCR